MLSRPTGALHTVAAYRAIARKYPERQASGSLPPRKPFIQTRSSNLRQMSLRALREIKQLLALKNLESAHPCLSVAACCPCPSLCGFGGGMEGDEITVNTTAYASKKGTSQWHETPFRAQACLAQGELTCAGLWLKRRSDRSPKRAKRCIYGRRLSSE
jgi:hypothetical protein